MSAGHYQVTMADLANGMAKLNNYNYAIWRTRVRSYLQGQDLWEVVDGSETTAPSAENAEALRKWRIKAGKARYVLESTIEDDLLVHIEDSMTPKEVWDTFAALFDRAPAFREFINENYTR